MQESSKYLENSPQGNSDSGIRKFLLVGSGILELEIWNTAQAIRNDWNPESKFRWQRIVNPVPEIQNPRLSWISLHGARECFILGLILHQTDTRKGVYRQLLTYIHWFSQKCPSLHQRLIEVTIQFLIPLVQTKRWQFKHAISVVSCNTILR